MNERLDRIANRNREAEQLLNQLNSALERHTPIPFDPGDLKDLVIYDYDGEKMAKFPLERTTYEIHEGKLLIDYMDCLHAYRLDRFSYDIEGR